MTPRLLVVVVVVAEEEAVDYSYRWDQEAAVLQTAFRLLEAALVIRDRHRCCLVERDSAVAARRWMLDQACSAHSVEATRSLAAVEVAACWCHSSLAAAVASPRWWMLFRWAALSNPVPDRCFPERRLVGARRSTDREYSPVTRSWAAVYSFRWEVAGAFARRRTVFRWVALVIRHRCCRARPIPATGRD